MVYSISCGVATLVEKLQKNKSSWSHFICVSIERKSFSFNDVAIPLHHNTDKNESIHLSKLRPNKLDICKKRSSSIKKVSQNGLITGWYISEVFCLFKDLNLLCFLALSLIFLWIIILKLKTIIAWIYCLKLFFKFSILKYLSAICFGRA